ncbi:hypothetical protein JZO76_04840 [Enterococcus sp. MJM12]|uniref:Gram-positive cocci surface proteins LPxTG domain-containing protein n=1 Tax=Candidatus Enterococcus myersii TaxID=2815322 RepID=A0ABS3H5X4_9ENTE|nr:hypothetical protein [Enterococcus sp. MJM12]MBO0448858.1 hypothetical protein [Enterococcus sp. MJM12]
MSKLLTSFLVLFALNIGGNFVIPTTQVLPEATVLNNTVENTTNPTLKTPPVLSPHVEPNLNQRAGSKFTGKSLRNIFAFGLGSILALLAIWRQRKN